MLFPLIKVKRKGSYEPGVYVGEDKLHHTLLLDENGNIKFHDDKTKGETGKDGEYEFVATNLLRGHRIRFVSVFDILNIHGEHLGIQDSELNDEFDIALQYLKFIFERAVEKKKQNAVDVSKLKCQKKYMDDIEKRRRDLGIGINDFTKRIGIPYTTYSNIRTCRVTLSDEIKERIEEVLKTA